MTDRDPATLTTFETELARELRVMSEPALRSNQAADIARRAILSAPDGVTWRLSTGWPRSVLILAILGLLIALSGWLLVTGGSSPKLAQLSVVPTASPVTSPGVCLTGAEAKGRGWATSSSSAVGRISADGVIAGLGGTPAPGGELQAMDPASGTIAQLTHLGVRDYKFPYLAASPDGSALAFSFQDVQGTDDQKLYVIAGGCAFEPDPTVPWEWDLAMAWSPDASQLAAMGRPLDSAPARGRVALLARDGSSTRFIDLPCQACMINPSMAWSPDGRWLAAPVVDTRTGTAAGVALVDPTQGTARMVEGSSLIGWLDDTELLVSTARDGGQVEVLPIDGTDARLLGWTLPADGTVALSPDGQRIASITKTGSGTTAAQIVSVRDVATGASSDLWTTPPGTESGFGFAWSPDETSLALDLYPVDGGPDPTDDGVWVIAVDGSGQRHLSSIHLGELVWIPPAGP